MTLIMFLPSQLCASLAFSLPCLSHLSFPSIFVVGPHRSLLSPGPLVTNKQTTNPLYGVVNETLKMLPSYIKDAIHILFVIMCGPQGSRLVHGTLVKLYS